MSARIGDLQCAEGIVADDQVTVGGKAGTTKRAYRFQSFLETYDIGKDAAYEAIRNGRLRAIKRGKATIIMADDAERYMASLPPLTLRPRIEQASEDDGAEPAPQPDDTDATSEIRLNRPPRPRDATTRGGDDR
jgi:hypothetical protein